MLALYLFCHLSRGIWDMKRGRTKNGIYTPRDENPLGTDSVVFWRSAAVHKEWEFPSVRVNSFQILPHGHDGAAITKKLGQTFRKLVLPVGKIGISRVGC